jgi:hypothetical protein
VEDSDQQKRNDGEWLGVLDCPQRLCLKCQKETVMIVSKEVAMERPWGFVDRASIPIVSKWFLF